MPNRGWESVRLEDVLESVFAGAWGESPTDVRRANVCVLRATNIDSEGRVDYSSPALRVLEAREISRKRLRPGDLLVEASGGGPGTPVGRVALHDIESDGLDYICSNFFRALRPKGNLVHPGYLAHVLVAAYHSPLIWRYQQQTTGLVNLKLGDYLKQSLWLPPIPEQVRIVEILAGFWEAEQGIRASIAKLRSVRQGIVTSLLSPAAVRQAAWAVTSLDSVAEVGGGLALGGISATGDSVELPYLRVANVQDGFISTAEMKMVRVTPVDARRFRLRPRDVLVTEGGDFDKVGRGAVWDGRIEPCLHQNHVFRVRCHERVMVPEFLAAYMASQAGRAYFLSVAKQTTNLASINSTQLKAMPVPCPPLSDQERVVEIIADCDKQISRETGELGKLRKLKQGLMGDLLSGRVEVSAVVA